MRHVAAPHDRVNASEAEARNKIDRGRTDVAQEAGKLSENYKATVRAGKVSPNHGGNRAVWDTVGANASQPELGTPPKVEPIGEWHFGKDGVPVMGPAPKSQASASSDAQQTDGQPSPDRGTRPGKP